MSVFGNPLINNKSLGDILSLSCLGKTDKMVQPKNVSVLFKLLENSLSTKKSCLEKPINHTINLQGTFEIILKNGGQIDFLRKAENVYGIGCLNESKKARTIYKIKKYIQLNIRRDGTVDMVGQLRKVRMGHHCKCIK